MDDEIPPSISTGVYGDLTNPRNNLHGYFAQIDRPGIARVVAERYWGLGPKGYGLSRYLALGPVSGLPLGWRLQTVALRRRRDHCYHQ